MYTIHSSFTKKLFSQPSCLKKKNITIYVNNENTVMGQVIGAVHERRENNLAAVQERRENNLAA